MLFTAGTKHVRACLTPPSPPPQQCISLPSLWPGSRPPWWFPPWPACPRRFVPGQKILLIYCRWVWFYRDTPLFITLTISQSLTTVLISVYTIELCGKSCLGAFCKIHLARLCKGSCTQPCKIGGVSVTNKQRLCVGCGYLNAWKRDKRGVQSSHVWLPSKLPFRDTAHIRYTHAAPFHTSGCHPNYYLEIEPTFGIPM